MIETGTIACRMCKEPVEYTIRTVEEDSGILAADRQSSPKVTLRKFIPEIVICSSCGQRHKMKDLTSPFGELWR